MSKHFIVCGMAFGDEGKGTIVDYLVRKYEVPLVVRFNGGAQAAHNVVLPDGRHHTFAQFGSGTFVPGVRTHLSRHVLVNPVTMWNEDQKLKRVGVWDAYERLTADPDALVTTAYHVWTNRWREDARGTERHGSCGMGIGETVEYSLAHPGDAIRVRDLADPRVLIAKLELQANRTPLDVPLWMSIQEVCDRLVEKGRRINIAETPNLDDGAVFEGAQGVLLDEKYGFAPHTTWSNCTIENAVEILGPERAATARKIGVLRTYFTRHGAGPFPTELHGVMVDDHNNGDHAYAGHFRVGAFDEVLARYGLTMSGCTEVALTHLDSCQDEWFAKHDPSLACCDHVPTFEWLLGCPIRIRSAGRTWKDKTEC